MANKKSVGALRLLIAICLFAIGGSAAAFCAYAVVITYAFAGLFGDRNIESLNIHSAIEVGFVFVCGILSTTIGQKVIRHRTQFATIVWMSAVFPLAFSYYNFLCVFTGYLNQLMVQLLTAIALALLAVGLALWGWMLWKRDADTEGNPGGE